VPEAWRELEQGGHVAGKNTVAVVVAAAAVTGRDIAVVAAAVVAGTLNKWRW
jgi:hypothetical protein